MFRHFALKAGVGFREIGGAFGDASFEVALRGAQLFFDQAPIVDFFRDFLIQPFHGFSRASSAT